LCRKLLKPTPPLTPLVGSVPLVLSVVSDVRLLPEFVILPEFLNSLKGESLREGVKVFRLPWPMVRVVSPTRRIG